MSRSSKQPRRLGLRLIVAHILVAVVCIFTFSLLFGSYMLLNTGTLLSQQKQIDPLLLEDAVAPQIAPYLVQSPPDLHAVQDWARDFVYQKGTNFGHGNQLWHELGDVAQVSLVQVVDTSGVILTSITTSEKQMNALSTDVRSKAVIRQALAYTPEVRQSANEYTQVLANGQIAVAVPILTRADQFLGAIFTVFSQTPLPATNYVSVAIAALSSALAAGFLGVLVGALVSGNVVRRTRQLNRALELWERGESLAFEPGEVHDELGQLSQKLSAITRSQSPRNKRTGDLIWQNDSPAQIENTTRKKDQTY